MPETQEQYSGFISRRPVQGRGPAELSVRFIYSLILYLLVPWVLLRLAWRGFSNRGYWQRWRERFGFVPRLPGPTIWLHAVSVGEVRASAPLVKVLSQDYPTHRLLITTMTPTGSATVRAMFGDSVAHCYVPYDLPSAVWRFLHRTKPRLAIIMETELWPNLFYQCRKRAVPLLLANARMSEKSARGYRRWARFTQTVLANVSHVGAQTLDDAERIGALGAASVEVTGSVKFELEVPPDLATNAAAWRRGFGTRPVWVAASTRDGEEALVLSAFAQLREHLPDLLLLLVPRHPERFESVAKLCRQRGFTLERRSAQLASIAPSSAILLGDSMGELLLFYAAADVAFIGGSLVPRGGQNLLEAAAVGTPVVFGPHMFNFLDISRMTLERGAGRQVNNATELANVVGEYLTNRAARQAAGAAGRLMVAENRGALQKTIALIKQVYPA